MSDWIILRTSGRTTMRLAESLAKDGFEVWTPIETFTMTVPRANVKRQVRRPIMPSYVFARVQHLVDLLELANLPVKPRRGAGLREAAHASFTVLHANDRIPLVADGHFAALRRLEAKRTPIERAAYSFPKGTSARVDRGIAAGLVGVVVRSTPKTTVLHFIGRLPFEIPTSLLSPNALCDGQPAALEAA